ncbi:YhgE/Pip domain-containing protein [uncultured Metabacillus sp.]|uniref:YhgE/Pip domain-containing protein n=1 Tax=uncultured Metabacillus sp. TaxID=2860135 RepID=UPI002608569D|nr:YhgE/Pip family protein [uncultured Metabacillus sp.]
MKNFFSQKLFWGGLLAIIVVVSIFMVGFMGSIVNPEPKDLPVAIVVEDKGVEMPNHTLNFGETVKETLITNKDIPFKWSVLKDKDEAMNGMNNRSYYAAIIIPENTSQNIAALLQSSPGQPQVEVITNEGMNYTAANTIGQIVNQMGLEMNTQVQNIMFSQLEAQSVSLPADKIKQVINPLKIEKQVINDVDSHTANGNTPVLFTQILWLSVFICSLILFITLKKTTNSQISLTSIASQVIGGILFLLVIVTSIMLFADYILDVNIPNKEITFLFLLLSGFTFFLLQNTLFNWIGVIAAPFILLMFLFSIPVLNLPVEFLPDLTKDWLYSWIPLKFSVEGLRGIFFFDNHNIGESLNILVYIGIGSLILMTLSIFKKQIKKEKQIEITNSN